MLTEILAGGSQAEPAPDWNVEVLRSVADIPLPSPESALEQRFRATFVTALRARGVAVKEVPQLKGTEVQLGVPGTTFRRWSLRPQVPVGGCVPDFQLISDDPGIPAVCIFTDGRAWHATAAHNRVADDATKRSVVRDLGNVVWAVTADDVATFEALERGEQRQPRGAAWFTQDVRTRMMQARAKAVPAGSVSDSVMTADAVTQLVDWVMQPRPDSWRSLADGLPLALMSAKRMAGVGRDRLAPLAASLLAGGATPSADPEVELAAWTWRREHLVVASAGLPRSPHDIGAVVVVDDAAEALATDSGEQAWRCWLALSNVLGHASRTALPMALSQAIAPAAGDAAPEPADVGRTTTVEALPAEWESLVAAAADAAEVGLLRALAAAGAALPEQGYETGDGVPIDLAWPTARVAVLLGGDDDAATGLTDHGWRVVAPGDLDQVLKLLATEPAST